MLSSEDWRQRTDRNKAQSILSNLLQNVVAETVQPLLMTAFLVPKRWEQVVVAQRFSNVLRLERLNGCLFAEQQPKADVTKNR